MKEIHPTELTDEQVGIILEYGIEGFEQRERAELVSPRPRPGKFEGNINPGLAEELYDRTLDGWCDDQRGSVDEGGWYGLLGRFIVTEDDRGFFGYEEFESTKKAEQVFRTIEP